MRYIGSAQHRDQKDDNKQRTLFSEEGICSACLYYEEKKKLIGTIERKNYLIFWINIESLMVVMMYYYQEVVEKTAGSCQI